MRRTWSIAALAFCLATPFPFAQERVGKKKDSNQAVSSPATGCLSYPRDKDRPVASLWDKPITLGEMVKHLEEDYCPGAGQVFSGPLGARTMALSLPILATLELDLILVRQEARRRGITLSKKELDRVLEEKFRKHFKGLVWKDPTREAALKANEDHIRKVFVRTAGPRTEVELLLAKMVPAHFSLRDLKLFYQAHGLMSQTQVKIAHIFIPRLDPATGLLPDPAGIRKRKEKILDIQARLKPDGSNFEEVARRFSALKKTARRGGFLGYVERWDPKHPNIARAAFSLRKGEWTGPVEEPEGFHFIKCLKILNRGSVFVVTQIRKELLQDMARQKREDLLVSLRKKAKAELIL